MGNYEYQKKCQYCKEYFLVTHGLKQLCPKCHAIHYNLETVRKVEKVR